TLRSDSLAPALAVFGGPIKQQSTLASVLSNDKNVVQLTWSDLHELAGMDPNADTTLTSLASGRLLGVAGYSDETLPKALQINGKIGLDNSKRLESSLVAQDKAKLYAALTQSGLKLPSFSVAPDNDSLSRTLKDFGGPVQ